MTRTFFPIIALITLLSALTPSSHAMMNEAGDGEQAAARPLPTRQDFGEHFPEGLTLTEEWQGKVIRWI